MMKKNYGLNYNRYDISVTATDSELILTINFLTSVWSIVIFIWEKANITAGLILEKPLMRKTEKETGRKMTISMPTMS